MRAGVFPRRTRHSHKGDYGHVFVVAGSLGFAGAACLCASGALRAGAGLVTVGVPERIADVVATKLTEAMVKPLPATRAGVLSGKAVAEIISFSKKADVLAVGPGIANSIQTRMVVHSILRRVEVPLALDADGLNVIATRPDVLTTAKGEVVITPHPGEFARLLDISPARVEEERRLLAEKFAKRYGVTVVLKGNRTVVASPGGHKPFTNPTGNPGMATGGTGDILTGMIAAFLGQRMAPFHAACSAVYAHGLAGDRAAKKKGQMSLIASDLLEELPFVLRKMTGEKT